MKKTFSRRTCTILLKRCIYNAVCLWICCIFSFIATNRRLLPIYSLSLFLLCLCIWKSSLCKDDLFFARKWLITFRKRMHTYSSVACIFHVIGFSNHNIVERRVRCEHIHWKLEVSEWASEWMLFFPHSSIDFSTVFVSVLKIGLISIEDFSNHGTEGRWRGKWANVMATLNSLGFREFKQKETCFTFWGDGIVCVYECVEYVSFCVDNIRCEFIEFANIEDLQWTFRIQTKRWTFGSCNTWLYSES